MRTTPRNGGIEDDDGVEATLPVDDLQPDARRRIGTLAFFGLIGIAAWAWYVLAAGGGDGSDRRSAAASDAPTPGMSALEPGTYRLPGLSTTVSLTLPEGWSAGDSIWGPAGQGVAAVSTGRPGTSVSLAVFDLDHLRPFDVPSSEPLDRPGDRMWFARSLEDYRSRVQRRVHDRVMGRQLEWRPPPVLAWLLTHTDRGPIEVADDVMFGGLPGDLSSFSFPGPASPLFSLTGPGTIALRPGVTYTFWVPRARGAKLPTMMLGIARELGAVPNTAAWDVVRTLELGA